MAYAEKLVKSWRACWRVPGKKTPEKESGFPSEKAALEYAQEREVEARRRGRRTRSSHTLTVEDYAHTWYAGLDLELGSMRGYKGILENHIVPTWGDWLLRDLADADVEFVEWIRRLRAAGYSESRIRAIRGRFSTMCSDAVAHGLLYRNPAAQQRSRGRAAPRRVAAARDREKKVTTSPLGALLIAERAAVLTGRDDEFTMLITKFYTGLRWGELIGIEKTLLSRDRLQVDWQLAEEGSQGMARTPPKRGSIRPIDLPGFLADLLEEQAERVVHPKVDGRAKWCPCGRNLSPEHRHEPGIHVFSGLGRHHWAHSTFLYQYWAPAALGRYYPGDKRKERLVYVDEPPEGGQIGPWDRTRRRASRWDAKKTTPDPAVACWVPIQPGMRRQHLLRHSHRTLLEELRTEDPLTDERMGHANSSIQARYSHVTPGMRRRLCKDLSAAWEAALKDRARILGTESPVPTLDRLLDAHRPSHSGSGSRSAPDTGHRPIRLHAV
ncbi:tyrosine-type recombinase/integrase [Streptomonospora halophila]|uniref:Tyrosine-type recombinase/integrase n=1 Tax=Streptomonospora halophila TaxID=427369 RepID=A0ABP9G5S5_9ACTN